MERRKRMNESKLGMKTSGGKLQRGVRFSRFYCRKRDKLAHVQWSLIGAENEKGREKREAKWFRSVFTDERIVGRSGKRRELS